MKPELPSEEQAIRSDHAVFLVDTSLSSNPERFNVWLALLQKILEKNRRTMKDFAVLFFNIEKHWWKKSFVPNSPENAKAFAKYAAKLALEGATDLEAALAEAARPAWLPIAENPRLDFFLLCDGAATWGERNVGMLARVFSGKGPIFAYKTGLTGGDDRALAQLARESGGAVFSVVGEAQIDAAASAHRARPWLIDSLALAGTSDLLLAGRPRSIYRGQEILLTGRGKPEAGAYLIMKLSRGGKSIAHKQALGSVIDSELATRVYGQVAVGTLEEFGRPAESKAKAYATQFRVTGKT